MLNRCNAYFFVYFLLLFNLVLSKLYPFDVNTNFIKYSRQLTFTGSNTEGFFSQNDSFVTFQANGGDYGTKCDQIYRLDLENLSERAYRLSTGIGDCSSPFFNPNNKGLIYSGTFHKEIKGLSKSKFNECAKSICQSNQAAIDPNLKKLCKKTKSLWHFNPDFDIFKLNKWSNFETQLTHFQGYDGEASISPDGKWIVFTSMRSGDPDLWLMNAHNKAYKRQLTKTIGYEGKAQFSPDSQRIVFHASVPTTKKEFLKYFSLLKYNLVELSRLNIYTIDLNGTNLKQITNFETQNMEPLTSWTPTYLPDGHRIVFSSNFNSKNPRNFHLFMVDVLEVELSAKFTQLTFHQKGFDAFPAVDSTGTKLLWSLNAGDGSGNSNLFIGNFKFDNGKKRFVKKKNNETFKPLNKLHFDGEKHLSNVQQITFGGQNAEGYFGFGDNAIVLQAAGHERYGTNCDQIYRANFQPKFPDKNTIFQRLSTGLGICTCSYFFPGDENSIHSSTFAGAQLKNISNTCPLKRCSTPEARRDPVLRQICKTAYTWDLFPDHDIYKVNKYGNIIKRLTITPGYDAEGAVSPDGSKIVFTSLRTGDPELWLMDADGNNLKQLTSEFGYDGGPFFSPDGTKIGFRASRPKTPAEIETYKKLLSYDLVEPLAMELYTINVDGTGMRKITALGGSNWAPFYLTDNQNLIFSSNFNATKGHIGAFDLYRIGEDASNVERITFNSNGFDAFPMISHNGKKLIWGSSRNGKSMGELNLFLADWNN